MYIYISPLPTIEMYQDGCHPEASTTRPPFLVSSRWRNASPPILPTRLGQHEHRPAHSVSQTTGLSTTHDSAPQQKNTRICVGKIHVVKTMLKQCHKPSPSHHHFFGVVWLPFPVMGGLWPGFNHIPAEICLPPGSRGKNREENPSLRPPDPIYRSPDRHLPNPS